MFSSLMDLPTRFLNRMLRLPLPPNLALLLNLPLIILAPTCLLPKISRWLRLWIVEQPG